MERVQVVNYQKSDILCIDFSGLKEESDILAVISQSKSIIQKKRLNPIYTLTNVSGMHFNNEIIEIFTKFTAENKDFVKASAIVGASGLQEIMITSVSKRIGRKFKLFQDVEAAKEWLIGPPLLVYYVRTSNNDEILQVHETVESF